MKSTTVKIPLADLISFRDNSGHIKSNNIMPILNYIKFDNGTIIKNNLKDFVVQKSNFTGTFLVDEKSLFNYMKTAKSSDILFTINDKKITISNGSRPAIIPTDDPENFPMPDTSGTKRVEVVHDILDAIKTAAHYASTSPEDEYHPIKPNIFVGAKAVAASDGMIAFWRKFNFEVPEIVLSKANADKIGTLSKDDLITYDTNERFHLFHSEGVTYGFIKLDAKFTDLGQYFTYEKSAANFVVNKQDLITFTDTCVSVSPSKAIIPSFSLSDNLLHCKMIDKDYDIDISEKITCNGTMDGSFAYTAHLMSKLLKTAPDDDLTFYQSKGKYFIIGDSGFNSLIMQIVD